ncbi:reverse transcriptase domain-containing protein [Tanacetum coccineum]
MSEPADLIPTPPTSAVQNTMGKGNEQTLENPNRPASNAALQEYCDKYYHQLLPIIAEKVHKEKTQQDKLKEVKARLNFEECSGRNSKIQEVSQYSECRTPNIRGDHERMRRSRRSRSISRSPEPTSVFSRIRRNRSESPKHRLWERTESVPRKCHHEGTYSRRTKVLSESEDSGGGHWKSRLKKQKSSIEEDDLSQPWVCEETDPFTPHIRYFDFPKKTWMPMDRWAMLTWFHMFNSTLTGSARVWFDDLPPESVDSYDDLKKTFLAKFLQQKKCIKDPIEIHHIKQREGESTEDFVQRFKTESRHEEVAASNQARKKTLPTWKQQETGRKPNFDKKGDFRNQQRSERRCDKFTILTKSPREILALDKGKFKTPPLMTTPVEKRNKKFCELHREVGHNTDKCMHLKRQIKELIKAGKLSHVIKELKQGSGKDQPKTTKKGEASRNDKAMVILMVQPWQRVARQRVTQSFSFDSKISFPPLGDEDGTEGTMIIEAEIGGHFIHRIYVDGG